MADKRSAARMEGLMGSLSPSDVVAAVAAEAVKMRMEGKDAEGLAAASLLESLMNHAVRISGNSPTGKKRSSSASKAGNLTSPQIKSRPQFVTPGKATMMSGSSSGGYTVRKPAIPGRDVVAVGPCCLPLMLQVTRAAVELDMKKMEMDHLSAIRLELEEKVEKLSNENTKLRDRCQQLENSSAKAHAAEQRFQSLLTWAKEEEGRRRDAETQLDTCRRELAACTARNNRISAESTEAASLLVAKRQQLETALEELRQRTKVAESADERARALASEASALRSLVAQREEELQTALMKVDTVVTEAKALTRENVSLQRAHAEGDATLKSLQASWERDSVERERAWSHKMEEFSALRYRLQQVEAHASLEKERRQRAEVDARRSEERERQGRSELLAATIGNNNTSIHTNGGAGGVHTSSNHVDKSAYVSSGKPDGYVKLYEDSGMFNDSQQKPTNVTPTNMYTRSEFGMYTSPKKDVIRSPRNVVDRGGEAPRTPTHISTHTYTSTVPAKVTPSVYTYSASPLRPERNSNILINSSGGHTRPQPLTLDGDIGSAWHKHVDPLKYRESPSPTRAHTALNRSLLPARPPEIG